MLDRVERRGTIALLALLCLLGPHRTYVRMSEERLWREAVSDTPRQAEPKIQLAKYVRAAEALDLLNRARQEAPHIPRFQPQWAGCCSTNSNTRPQSRAVAMNPKDALAFANRGVALAATDFERALALDPQIAEARENLKRLKGK